MNSITVIDDDEDLCTGISEILAAAGFDVLSHPDIDHWFAEESAPPDIVIIDDLMPGIRGMQAIPFIRRKYPLACIIMSTAFASVDHAVEAMRAGAHDYLEKPFRKDTLMRAVMRQIEERRLGSLTDQPDIDVLLAAVSNPIRRSILDLLARQSPMRFMEITRQLEIEDHTKVNFHLKNLRQAELIEITPDRAYGLTGAGMRVIRALTRLDPHG